jgi:hypothetical protein
VAVLSTSTTMASGQAMAGAFAAGMLLAIPGAWLIARQVLAQRDKAA